MKYICNFLLFLNLAVVSFGAPHLGIMGGNDADILDIPYVANVFNEYLDEDFKGYLGPATILNENTLVTSGFITNGDMSKIRLTIGYGNTKRNKLTIVNVTKVYTHEKYDPKNGHYDIGIIKVDPPIVFGENAQPVNLPHLHAPTPAGEVGVVASWGQASFSASPYTLQWLDLTVTTDEFCKESYKGRDFHIDTDIQICARNAESTKKDPKNLGFSDVGSALTIDLVLYGIANFQSLNQTPYDLPYSFTKVSEFTDWIKSHM